MEHVAQAGLLRVPAHVRTGWDGSLVVFQLDLFFGFRHIGFRFVLHLDFFFDTFSAFGM